MMNVSDVYLDNILAGKNVEFFVYNAEGKINKIYDSSTLGTDQDEDWFLDYSSSFDYVITFCSTKTSNYLDFVDFTKLMRLYSIQTFNFILNDGADYPYSVNQDYERLAGIHEDKYDEYLTDMLYLFLVDDYLSLENYDAWIGVCGVTFRPFYPGPGGWILSNYTTDEDGTIGFN